MSSHSPTSAGSSLGVDLTERGLVPDAVVRWAIRRLLRQRLESLERADARGRQELFLGELAASPIALATDRANVQHYEVPAAFFERVLGPRLKYSCAHFAPGTRDLAGAEEEMLALTCARAELEDGMTLLDLGCGWGSLSLYVAERFPRCRILAVSNSKSQREHILARAAALGTDRLRVETADINAFDPDAGAEGGEGFDRVVSVEMFEHARNWGLLLARIASWLRPGGKLFVHHFSHREHAYPYVVEEGAAGGGDWMARHFFTGGMMPSHDWIRRFPDAFEVERSWQLSGLHYQRTCDAWLARLDAARNPLRPLLAEACGEDEAGRAFHRWRLFFLACSELFGFRGGREWRVSHHLLGPR